MTAAHPTLSCGTLIAVTNRRNGKSVTVRVNDRGPAAWTHRIIDLTPAAAAAIGIRDIGRVEIKRF